MKWKAFKTPWTSVLLFGYKSSFHLISLLYTQPIYIKHFTTKRIPRQGWEYLEENYVITSIFNHSATLAVRIRRALLPLRGISRADAVIIQRTSAKEKKHIVVVHGCHSRCSAQSGEMPTEWMLRKPRHAKCTPWAIECRWRLQPSAREAEPSPVIHQSVSPGIWPCVYKRGFIRSSQVQSCRDPRIHWFMGSVMNCSEKEGWPCL